MPGSVDDALDRLHEMADELGLEDDEREQFIESSMTRKGYQQRSTWAEPEGDDGGKSGGDYFTRRPQRGRETRRVPTDKGRGGFTRYA